MGGCKGGWWAWRASGVEGTVETLGMSDGEAGPLSRFKEPLWGDGADWWS